MVIAREQAPAYKPKPLSVVYAWLQAPPPTAQLGSAPSLEASSGQVTVPDTISPGATTF